MHKELINTLNKLREKNLLNEVVIKEMIKFCELEWDPKCLLFYNNKHPIKTASAFQVRQPIYDSSIELDAVLFDKIFLNQNFNDI